MFFKKKIVNETFGKLVYDLCWRRDVTYELWGKTYNLQLKVETSNEGHEILKIQEQAYKDFLANLSKVEETVKSYFLEHYYEFVEDYYISCGTSWALTPAHKKQLERIIDSHEIEGKVAIDDMMQNIVLYSFTVEEDGKIYANLYVNIPDGHGLLLVIDSDIKLLTAEEFE